MGGAHRKPISAIEKRQRRIQQQQARQQARGSEKRGASPFLSVSETRLIRDLRSMKVITPATLAMRYEIMISTARRVLRDLERRGVVQRVSGNARLPVYTIAASA
ncbi:MarR family transcriptional regulator [archaeon]|nr:MarR family transcriptional regulator [archaeon]